MNKKKIFGIAIAEIVYFLLFILGSSSGLIHPGVYAYIGALLPLGFAFCYLYTAANMQHFGAAAVLNGVLLIIAIILGEGNWALISGLVVLTVLAEVIRALFGYNTLRGVLLSFIPFAFSFFAYTAHWWTQTDESLGEALEMFNEAYESSMRAVIENTPVLLVVLLITIPVAIAGMRLAEKTMKKQTALLL